MEEARAEERLDEVAVPFDAASELAALGIPEERLSHMRRMRDIEFALSGTLRREFHRDCVELARRLA